MSLDVYLYGPKPPLEATGTATIYVRENGSVRELSRDEWDERFPGTEPVTVENTSQDYLFSANITHNLGKMADAAGIYMACWRPEEIGITHANQLIGPLTEGLAKLKSEPKKFEPFNASNGWGLYKHFVPWVEKYLEARIANPDARVEVSR